LRSENDFSTAAVHVHRSPIVQVHCSPHGSSSLSLIVHRSTVISIVGVDQGSHSGTNYILSHPVKTNFKLTNIISIQSIKITIGEISGVNIIEIRYIKSLNFHQSVFTVTGSLSLPNSLKYEMALLILIGNEQNLS
jgi:hypothetical protein